MCFKVDIKKEVNGEILKEPAVMMKFEDGYYTTDDLKKIAFIKSHSDYGVNIFEVEEAKFQNKL